MGLYTDEELLMQVKNKFNFDGDWQLTDLLESMLNQIKELKREVEKQQRLNRLLTKKTSPRTGQRTIK